MPQKPFDQVVETLISKAEAALELAYAPYSHFQVAAALLLEDGTCITGTNQENAAYPLCMCAERVALYTKASVHPALAIEKLVVIARKEGNPRLIPATPCGACRQVIAEFEARQNRPIEMIMLEAIDSWLVVPSAASLLPYTFTGSNLTA